MKATLVDSVFADPNPAAGSFAFYQWGETKDAGILFVCPCGCGDIGSANFAEPVKPQWTWDGNHEAPTISPSIRKLSGCMWHGYLRHGEWVPA